MPSQISAAAQRALFLLFCLAGSASLAARAADGRLIHVGPQRTLHTIAAAAVQARDGDTIEIDAGEYPGDVAVWTQDRITIRGVGGPVRLIAAGMHAEGKGIWVVRGGLVTVENIEFSDAKVPDHNGAGIRFEKGHLIVRRCVFKDSENGLMTGGEEAQLQIEDSEFANNGNGDGFTHNLYVGAIKKLTVRGSYFHHARVGHLIKSRAAENFIINNRLTDETGGKASYELEFPNGGIAYVIGNIIEQSATTSNTAMIAVGGEGYKWPRNELYLINNTLANDRAEKGIFLSVKPGITVLKGINNLLIGNGESHTGTTTDFGAKKLLPGWRDMAGLARGKLREVAHQSSAPAAPALKGQFANNVNVGWDQVALAARYDYRIVAGSALLGKFVDPGMANGVKLAPDAEYSHPHSTVKLAAQPLLPGALQTLAATK